jgi:hypothetical protein
MSSLFRRLVAALMLIKLALLAALSSAHASETASRQATLDRLLSAARARTDLGIAWTTVAEVAYDDESTGSKTDATDPQRIRVTIGTTPFECSGDLASTFRHELVHVAQHQNQALALKRGWGIQEVEAYLWELEHASETHLGSCSRRLPSGRWDTSHGIARAVDGLFRYLVVLENELAAHQADIGMDELKRVNARVSCALRPNAAIVREMVPELDWNELPKCN